MSDDINLDEYDLVPKLAECQEMNLFADELTSIVKRIENLPYGVLAILVYSIKDILTGEEDVFPTDIYPLLLKAYYIISVILLTKNEIILTITKKDLTELSEIIESLVGKISVIEMSYSGYMNAKFMDGEWNMELIEGGEEIIQNDLIKKAIRKLYK